MCSLRAPRTGRLPSSRHRSGSFLATAVARARIGYVTLCGEACAEIRADPEAADRRSCAVFHRLSLDETSLVHAKPAALVLHLVEIAVVMGDHDHGRAPAVQGRQHLVVELAAKLRILIGRPFVEQ